MYSILRNRGGNIVKRLLGYFVVVGLVSTSIGCGDEDSNPTSSSVSQDSFAEKIVGEWKIEGQLAWTFNGDSTVVYDGYEEYNFTWKIEGNRLTITDMDTGEIWSKYDIKSLSSNEMVTVDPEYPDFENKYIR
tara:strand:+ start:187 stop:585 length:399 start_codon:yes stop_codon:yes gene_type:complete